MECLKCGKNTKDEQVFCPQCLSVMEAYPVRPDVHIQLPNHAAREQAKKVGKKRRTTTPDEQIAALRRKNRRLSVLILVLVLLLGVAGYALFHIPETVTNAEWGTNYQTSNSSSD